MPSSFSLPEPSPEAIAHSLSLTKVIKSAITSAGNWLPFSRFMELALYKPGLGYYTGGAHKFGSSGDFVTAPELTPLFAETLAQQIAQLLRLSQSDAILEAGAGSGRLAADLMQELDKTGTAPSSYTILELSGELRARQKTYLRTNLPHHLFSRITWCSRLPARFDGVVLANELLDALPAHIVVWHGTQIHERGVSIGETGEFVWAEQPAKATLVAAAREIADMLPDFHDGYYSEIGLAGRAWVETWGGILGRGALLLIDYGFPRYEYYHPQRNEGTLMCHYRHRAHTDPFFLPGLQDITAHVDFSAITEAGLAAGLDLIGFATQTQFLCNCGLLDRLVKIPAETAAYYRASSAVQKLIFPSEMGELFKVIALGRGIEEPLLGFGQSDRRYSL